MRIDILTIFPEMFEGVLGSSMLGRARQNGLVDIRVHNIRDYPDNKHKKTDDYPFGGGAGMVMMVQPIFDCVDAVLGGEQARRILLSPRGRTLNQKIARNSRRRAAFTALRALRRRGRARDDHYGRRALHRRLCAHRRRTARHGLTDCLSRFIPGVLGSEESAADESFSDGLLEYPQYTRPAEFRGMEVPEVLLNGHHAKIQAWRLEQARLKTALNRPDLLTENTDGESIEAPDDAWL